MGNALGTRFIENMYIYIYVCVCLCVCTSKNMFYLYVCVYTLICLCISWWICGLNMAFVNRKNDDQPWELLMVNINTDNHFRGDFTPLIMGNIRRIFTLSLFQSSWWRCSIAKGVSSKYCRVIELGYIGIIIIAMTHTYHWYYHINVSSLVINHD